jgi:hypothetical protein
MSTQATKIECKEKPYICCHISQALEELLIRKCVLVTFRTVLGQSEKDLKAIFRQSRLRIPYGMRRTYCQCPNLTMNIPILELLSDRPRAFRNTFIALQADALHQLRDSIERILRIPFRCQDLHPIGNRRVNLFPFQGRDNGLGLAEPLSVFGHGGSWRFLVSADCRV